jgi:uncharacterized protein YndB with AHSA1/START domain
MSKSTFVYTIYIAATADKVWKALLDGEFTRQYWQADNVSDWQPGSQWEHRRAGGDRTVMILGQVVEAEAPRRLVLTWAEPKDKNNAARHSRVALEIESVADSNMVRLTVTHDQLESVSDMFKAISTGWPRVLSSLKSLLETGRALNTWADR